MRWLAFLLLVTLAACRPPLRLTGDFPKTTVLDAQQGGYEGERVRWGGTIVSTTPSRDRTCMEIVALPLDRRARPRFFNESLGRFIACAPGFYDPKVFEEEREVTVIGVITTPQSGKVGDYDYVYPRIDADTVWLWPDRRRSAPDYYASPWGYPYPYPYYYPYGPYWYGYPYYYGGWWYGGGGWHHDGHHDHDGGHDGHHGGGGHGGGGGGGGGGVGRGSDSAQHGSGGGRR
jgi:outer membrane lipoprotein